MNRRELVKGSLAVLGFDLVTRGWVTGTEASADKRCARLPRLDGQLLVDEPARAAAAQDYGNFVHHAPWAVLRPASHDDVVEMIRFANECDIKTVVRGQGHSTFGQSQVQGGLQIDMSTLDTVHEVGPGYAIVDGGCRWRQVLDAALAGPSPQSPMVMNGYSQLSVGGTLSVGGISGMAYRVGCQVEHVLELKVITGDGHVRRCSARQHRDLFEAVLAGQGQCAVILQAELRLRPVKPRVRDYTLVFPTLEAVVQAMNTLLDEQQLDLIYGGAQPVPGGWIYVIFADKYYDPRDGLPNDAELLARVSPVAPPIIDDLTYRQFITKTDASVEAVPRGPDIYPLWVDLFLPRETLVSYAGSVLANTRPDDLGAGALVLFFPLETATNTRPLFRLPASSRVFLFDYFRQAGPITRDKAEELVARNRALYEQSLNAGATIYPITSIPFGPEDWRRHYGPAWHKLRRAKRRYDPRGVLGSGVAIF